MPSLYVAEYVSVASANSILGTRDNPTAAPQEPPIAEYIVAINGSTTAGPVVNPNTRLIRIHSDSICSIAVGVSPTATTSNKRLAANQTEYFGVNQGYSVAVILNV